MVHALEYLRCGVRRISFACWSCFTHGTLGKMEYKKTLSTEGLQEEAWEPGTINVITSVDGELIDMLPTTEKCVLPVTA